MRKLYVHTIIGSSGGDCVLIILFQIYGSRAALFEVDLFWVGQYDHPPPQPSFGRRTNPI